ncbi:MAG: hypothetical protein HYW64_02135 [Candidatus Levybacteria bacterium]|nr:hypothetical protein [Candidatus Levybacteria bacterium]
MFPLPFILTGMTLSDFPKVLHKFLPRIEPMGKTLVIIALLILVWLNAQGIPFRFSPNRQKEYRYFFKLAGKDPVIIETFKNDPKRQTVADQLLIVCEDPECKPLGHSLWEVAGFGRAEIAGEWQVSVVKVYKLVRYEGK